MFSFATSLTLLGSHAIGIAALLVCLPLGLLLVQFVHMSCILVATEKETDGGRYYRMSADNRERFRNKLKFHRRLLAPVLWTLRKSGKFSFDRNSFQYKGVSGPKGTCSPQTFHQATLYNPQPDDVFVVSQMKCGTTWMQHLVYEVLCRGNGTLADTGTTLGSVSPWIESTKSATPCDAPLVGQSISRRIIKTHLPVELCPFNDQAKYVCIARNPMSCFASCRDFILNNLGEYGTGTIPDSIFESWFCSRENMWWTDWPHHVDGWWKAANLKANVHMILFEELKKSPCPAVNKLAEFLGVSPLSESELDEVLRKCSFEYMKEHAELFAMFPPHLLQDSAEVFVSGKLTRDRDVETELRDRINVYCRERCREFPFDSYYCAE